MVIKAVVDLAPLDSTHVQNTRLLGITGTNIDINCFGQGYSVAMDNFV